MEKTFCSAASQIYPTHTPLVPVGQADNPGALGTAIPTALGTQTHQSWYLKGSHVPIQEAQRQQSPSPGAHLSGPMDLTPFQVFWDLHTMSCLSRLPPAQDSPGKSGSSPQQVEHFTVDEETDHRCFHPGRKLGRRTNSWKNHRSWLLVCNKKKENYREYWDNVLCQ